MNQLLINGVVSMGRCNTNCKTHSQQRLVAKLVREPRYEETPLCLGLDELQP
jgi:hypothetical protein